MKPSHHLILCHPLLFLLLIFPSIRVFANELVLHIRWRKRWSFSPSISPFNEYSRLLFFRIDWFDFLAVQDSPKSLLQHHSSNASILSLKSHLNITDSPDPKSRLLNYLKSGMGGVSLVAQLVKNLPAMQETLVQFLGWEDPLEKGKATHSSILAWRIPWTV